MKIIKYIHLVYMPPIAGQIYKDGDNEYRILKVEKGNVYIQNVGDSKDEFSFTMGGFNGLKSWKLIKGGGKSKKRRRKNKRRTLRSGKIRKFFGF